MTIRSYSTLTFLLFTAIFSFSQNLNHEWSMATGSTVQDRVMAIYLDSENNIIEMGNYRGTVDMDPGIGTVNYTSQGFYDTYIRKLDPSGNLLWAKSVGGNLDDVGRDVHCDQSGNVYITGNFTGTGDFDPGAGVVSYSSVGVTPAVDIFILKLDPNGNYLWSHQIGDSLYERGFALDTDDANNLYVGGYFYDTLDFDPGPGVANLTATGLLDMYILKLDSDGNFIWAQSVGGVDEENITDLAIDSENNILITGSFVDVVDFNTGISVDNHVSNGTADFFVSKLDSAGNTLWTVTEGGISDDVSRNVKTDRSDNIYICGYFSDIVDFDPTTATDLRTSNGFVDAFVQKFSPSGALQWTKTFGSDSTDIARAISLDTFGNVFLIGDFYDTVDFNPGAGGDIKISGGKEDLFVSKLDSDGSYYWTETAGDTLQQIGLDLVVNQSGNLYIAGNLNGETDYDFNAGSAVVQSAGMTDAYLAKYNFCIPSAGIMNNISCNEYTSPSGNYIWTSSGIYTDTLSNMNQCGEDSILYITLTINTVDINISQLDEITLSADQSGASYQWIECSTGPIAGETAQQFTATQNGDYAVIISLAGCEDSSECVAITSVGLDDYLTEEFAVYPNPSSGKVFIDLKIATDRVELRDLNGRLLQTIDVSGKTECELNLAGANGCYFITLYAGDKVYNRKVIKQ